MLVLLDGLYAEHVRMTPNPLTRDQYFGLILEENAIAVKERKDKKLDEMEEKLKKL